MEEIKKPGTGRGKLRELLRLQLENQPSSSHSSTEVTKASSRPLGRGLGRGLGRADFIKKLRSQALKPCTSSIGVNPKPSSSVPVGSISDKTTDVISEKLKALELQDDSPSISEHRQLTRGEAGDQIRFSTNYVYLNQESNISVFEYEVKFIPEVLFVNYRFRILNEHFQGKKDVLCYDGAAKLFTPEKITDSVVKFQSKHPSDDSSVDMIITFKRQARAKDCAVLYNTLFKNCSRILSLTRFKNKFYDQRAVHRIPQHKLEIWPGFVTSVDEFDGGIQLCCDVSHRVLRTDSALDILAHTARFSPTNFKVAAEKNLLGECVLTRYNNYLYRIDDIDWEKTPKSTFKLSSGEEITFLEYYKKQYNIDIGDLNQPLLINRAKNILGKKSRLICLVPELCHMTGLTDKMRSDIRLMKDVAMYTRVTPAQRVYAFKQFLRNIRSSSEAQEMLKKWGFSIAEEPVQLDGRILPSETLIFGNEKVVSADTGDWKKYFRDVSVFQSVDILSWIIIYPTKDKRAATSFVNMIRKIGPGLGIEISEPTSIQLIDDRIDTYIQALRKNINETTQVVVCICPTARDDRYSAIKKFCCKEMPVPSQVINTVTLSRDDRMRSVVQNIALQINNKLGGASWAIRIPFKNTMICGVDTYHDKSQATSAVGGLVASSNADFTEWFSKANFQGPKQELIDGLVQSFLAALKYYLSKNHMLPDRIIVYRDGVSDGQMETCKDFEVSQFLEACRLVSTDYKPKFAYVIVQKRISAKFYEFTGKNSGNIENVRAGGIVDHTITKKSYFDFYLVSQMVRVGTATPTHYVVLYDNSGLKPDHIQRLTYKFCHLYYNWPGTVRIPAPCAYAHKLAYIIGKNIKAIPDERLGNKLYYL